MGADTLLAEPADCGERPYGHSLNEKSDTADRPQNCCPEGLHRKWALAALHALAS